MSDIECPICLESFTKEDTIEPSACQHRVCFVCVVKLIYISRIMKNKCKCPMCRADAIYRLNECKCINDDDLPVPIDHRND